MIFLRQIFVTFLLGTGRALLFIATVSTYAAAAIGTAVERMGRI